VTDAAHVASRGPARFPSRRQALATGAALAAFAIARPAAAAAQPSDADQLERLLFLERRLETVYRTALARDAIEAGLGGTLLEHEREHVRGLEQALRGRRRSGPRAGVPPPRVGAALTSRPAFARFAVDLETETVRAYQDVLATLRNDRLLQPLGSIMASGSQHAIALRGAIGDELIPLA
jgi:rubrerythrin